MKLLIPFLIILAAGCASTKDSDPVVTMAGGQVQGLMLDNGGAVFKGIPYAQPPVGDLRWREPIPVEPWVGVRDTTEYGPMCAQVPVFLVEGQDTSEDCLTLNVWAPEWPVTSGLPVMVWIPGGGNFAGGSGIDMTDGESLSSHGVVVVSFNYRLGPFGFFAHPALTLESPHNVSGNQGILDQIAALKWVQNNIGEFGGDPENVTVFGVSAGSLNASVLMTTSLSQGLFHRVIGQSGNAIHAGKPLSLQEAEEHGQAKASRWKVPTDASPEDLRAVPVSVILAAESDTQGETTTVITSLPSLGIVVDGYVFQREPSQVFAAGQQHGLPLMLGSNAREQIPLVSLPTDLAGAIAKEYGPLAEQAQSLYQGDADPHYGTPVEQWGTDTSFRCSTVTQLLWHAAAGNPAFEYEFARIPKGHEALGATHVVEVNYVFGTLDQGISGKGPLVPATQADFQISDAMQKYWTNFAKTGDPNGGDLPIWSRFNTSSRAYMQFTDSGPVAMEGLRRPFCDLYIENIKRLMGPK